MATATVQPLKAASSACNSTVDGSATSTEVCALATRIYGSIASGHYWLDKQGN